MRVFITGASGFIGSAVVAELVAAEHEVIGLARSDEAAAAVETAGGTVLRGSIVDTEALGAAATASDGVIHLAFNHDFSRFEASAQEELRALESLIGALAGSGRPLVTASGVIGLVPGRVATESEPFPTGGSPRTASAHAVLAAAERGVRSSAVRLAPSVHDEHPRGFVGRLVDVARQTGVSGYVGDGSVRWPAVHRLDAAHLFCRALENAPAGSILHGVGDQGVRIIDIAELIGRGLGVPTAPIPADKAAEQFGFLAPLLALDSPATSEITQELLGWAPTHPGLLEDLEQWFAEGLE